MRLDEMSFQDLVYELPRLPFRKRVLLMFVLWLFLAIASFFLFWKDSMLASKQLEITIQESLDRLNRQSLLLLERPAIEAELAELEVQLPLLKMALPSERELASLLERINDLILGHELKLAEFTPKEPLNREVMRVVPVTVSVRGKGGDISRLPNYIAALSRQVSLKEFDMAYLSEEGVWQMTGELNAYAQLPVNATQTGTESMPDAQTGEAENP